MGTCNNAELITVKTRLHTINTNITALKDNLNILSSKLLGVPINKGPFEDSDRPTVAGEICYIEECIGALNERVCLINQLLGIEN